MAPALGNRPSVHLLDVKFDSCVGNNVLCVSPNVEEDADAPQSDNVKLPNLTWKVETLSADENRKVFSTLLLPTSGWKSTIVSKDGYC